MVMTPYGMKISWGSPENLKLCADPAFLWGLTRNCAEPFLPNFHSGSPTLKIIILWINGFLKEGNLGGSGRQLTGRRKKIFTPKH